MTKQSTYLPNWAGVIFGVLLAAVCAQAAAASDKPVILPVDAALIAPEAKKALDGSVAFYFGNSSHPAILKTFGNFVTNKKSNAFAKSDTETCNWVLLSALITLQDRAHAEGGNAVVNIRSFYKKKEVSYDKEFECHVGTFVSGVTLKGDVVKLKR